jgi:alpha-soluble NSF attachment protein
MSSNTEANDLVAQAKKKASYSGWFGGNKFDEAADLYQRAANSYKLSKDCGYILFTIGHND